MVGWNKHKNKLDSLYIGSIAEYPYFQAKHIIEYYEELRGLTPDIESWEPELLKSNPPRYYRLLRLMALLDAFGIGSEYIKDINKGTFIENRPLADYKKILTDYNDWQGTEENKKLLSYSRHSTRELTHEAIQNLYFHIYQFLNTVKRLQYVSVQKTYIGDRLHQSYIYSRTKDFLNEKNLEFLDHLKFYLYSILDPYNRNFKKQDLIKLYKFPDVNIHEIDGDWA
jgi:hypothetical protein